jgi:hypothetical protein
MFEKFDNLQKTLNRMTILEQSTIDAVTKIIPDATLLEISMWMDNLLPRGRRLTQRQLDDWYNYLSGVIWSLDLEEKQMAKSCMDAPAVAAALKAAASLPAPTNTRTPKLTADKAADEHGTFEEAAVAIYRNRALRAAQRAELARRKQIRAVEKEVPENKRQEFRYIIQAIDQGLVTHNLRVTPKGHSMCELHKDPNEQPDIIPDYAVFAQSKRAEVIE